MKTIAECCLITLIGVIICNNFIESKTHKQIKDATNKTEIQLKWSKSHARHKNTSYIVHIDTNKQMKNQSALIYKAAKTLGKKEKTIKSVQEFHDGVLVTFKSANGTQPYTTIPLEYWA